MRESLKNLGSGQYVIGKQLALLLFLNKFELDLFLSLSRYLKTSYTFPCSTTEYHFKNYLKRSLVGRVKLSTPLIILQTALKLIAHD